jgi:peroxiredoxin
MRRLILFITISLVIYSCDKNGVVIKGKMDNPKGSYVYLQELTVDGKGLSDSVMLSKSGFFKFKREQTYPVFYSMWIGQNREYITLLAKPGERIKITGNADSLFQTYQVTGSQESKNVQVLTQRFNKTLNSLDSLNNVYLQFLNSRNIANIRQILSMNYSNVVDEQRKFTISFIDKNPSSLACILALYQKLDTSSWVLYKEDDLKYYIKVDSALFKEYRNSPHVNALHANIQRMKEQQQTLKIQRMLSIMGAKAPEVALPSVKGDTVRLSSFKGKAVLLYFWASWSQESRKQNKELVNLYNKYKGKGFEIYQVSLDKTKDAWMKAIKEDGLLWTQVCDFKYWQSPVVNLFNFSKIPTSFLIDKSGTIISRDLKGDDLNDKLASILEEKSNTAGKQAGFARK